MIEEQVAEVSTCPLCGADIDPNWCYCGSPLDQHGHYGHSFVPMGCMCYFTGGPRDDA